MKAGSLEDLFSCELRIFGFHYDEDGLWGNG